MASCSECRAPVFCLEKMILKAFGWSRTDMAVVELITQKMISKKK